MWTRLAAATLSLLMTSASAFAQVNIKPDTTPRLPPQAGQALPVEDQEFLGRAQRLSSAEIEAAKLGAEKAADPELKQLSTDLLADHTRLLEGVREQAARHKTPPAEAVAQQPWTTDIAQFKNMTGEAFDREYLRWQIRVHLALVALYQVQASNTPASDLAKFGITRLNEIQRRFDTVKALSAKHGLKVETVGNPPQY